MSSNWQKLSDNQLYQIMALKGKDAEKAFGEIYARLSSRTYAYCKRILVDNSEAQDAFQETFAKLYQSATPNKEMTNLAGYILRIARNMCLSFRKEQQNLVSYNDLIEFQSSNREDDNELLNLIKVSLDLLPDDQREAFVLREYDGFSYQDIADITDENVGTIKVRIYRAKQGLRKLIQPYFDEYKKIANNSYK